MKKASIALLSACIGLAGVCTQASPLLYDGFSGYAGADLAGQSTSASGYAGGGSWNTLGGTVTADPGSGLTYGPLLTSPGLAQTIPAGFNGVQAAVNTSATGAFAQAGLVDANGKVGGSDVSGTVYYSFLARTLSTDVPNGSEDFAAVELYSGGSEVLGVGNNWPAWAFSTFGAGGDGDLVRPSDSSYLTLDSNIHMFVVKVAYNSNADDNITVWMDPSLSTDEAGQPNTVYTRSMSGNAAFDSFALRSGSNNNDNAWQFDEVRFGTTWQDVTPVPEPATLGLIGLSALGLLGRRRRA